MVRDVLSHSASGARARSQQAFPERVGVDEPREGALAVDLDHRQQLPVARLERLVAVDLDHRELERHVRPDTGDDLERRVTEVAAAADDDRDPARRYG
jgi:hypothetical protein